MRLILYPIISVLEFFAHIPILIAYGIVDVIECLERKYKHEN